MHRTSCLVPLLVVVLVAGSWGALTSATADATPGASPEASPDASRDVTFPITPAPAGCAVEPRSPESLAALLGTPVAAAQFPEPFVAEVPVGQPAEEEVTAAITATVLESEACFNANDSLRAFTLFSDAFLQGYVERNALTGEDITMLVAPAREPAPVEVQTTILAVTDVMVLADGQTGAFVVTSSPWRGLDTRYMVFVQQGERWLIDDVIPFLAA